jgi:hypothetical protein
MYDSTTTVTVGLDVHARSIRLAAVRADEHGFGLYRHLVERGID